MSDLSTGRAEEMSLPELTHLQFLVLDVVQHDPHSGRFIRDRLAEEGEKKSGPAFYQLMSRLEDSGLVSGWYESFVVDGQTIKERRYEITRKGIRARERVRAFYAARGSNRSVQYGAQDGSSATAN
jgi:DNA-binding PadR family transcriptional regulator